MEPGDAIASISDSSWEDVDEDDEARGSHVHPLLLNSLVLEKIFEFLPLEDLLTCRLVCKEWGRTALLRKIMGLKVEIRITSLDSLDKLLKIAQNFAQQPFCRKFHFGLEQPLGTEKISKFAKYFGERISNLSISNCTFSSDDAVIKLLNCPRLEELSICGSLPTLEESFHSNVYRRLRKLSIHSDIEYGQVKSDFVKSILRLSPNLQVINIGYNNSLWDDFCSVLKATESPKLCQIEFEGLNKVPLQNNCFENFLSKRLVIQKLSFRNCLVSQEFLEQVFLQTFQYLRTIAVEGPQLEMLTKAFTSTTLPHVQEISLPIDGVALSEGILALQSCPRLKRLIVTGLLKTTFELKNGNLLSVAIREVHRCQMPLAINHEKRRELAKVLSLIPKDPEGLEINLPYSNLNSKCLRWIYFRYPNLRTLKIVMNSAKQCIVGLTGISSRLFRRIAYCSSFSVITTDNFCMLPSLSKLQNLKHFDLTLVDEIPNRELTLILFIYGICSLQNLDELILNNVEATDVSLMILAQRLKLSLCKINGSYERWIQFRSFYAQHTIKSFLLPPISELDASGSTPAHLIGTNIRLLQLIFSHLENEDIFAARTVCKQWHNLASNCLHKSCMFGSLTGMLEARLSQSETDSACPPSPSGRTYNYYQQRKVSHRSKVFQLWNTPPSEEGALAIVAVNKSTLEKLQFDNSQLSTSKRNVACQERKVLEYWYYPDGSDQIIHHLSKSPHSSTSTRAAAATTCCDITTLIAIGCWGRKDDGLVEFLNPKSNISTIQLIGLQKEALDLVLPKMTQLINLESLVIKPLINTTPYCELTKTHLQILCNALFKLRTLSMQLHAPSEAVVEFVRSQRFTLETLELHSIVNISDRLTFSMPELKVLQLDEPPGCLLWTTLNIHSTLKTIGFGRNGSTSNQVKNKASPKKNPLESDFEHSATEILCDVNWFLENSVNRTRTGVQKSILQHGSDSALKFFTHFPYLSSLTLRGVHAHYGILQGIFKKFPQLKKLELIGATGVTDEIITGFSKEVLDDMDIMNPFQIRSDRSKVGAQRKGSPSIRNLKCLTHLTLDDQPACTDFSVIFALLKLSLLESLSCKKWKITDISIRAMTDILPSLKQLNTTGCATVSKYALEYFKHNRRCQHNRTFSISS